MQELQQIENELLLTLNYDGGAFMDNFWWFLTNKLVYVASVVAILAYAGWRSRSLREVLLLAGAIVLLGLCTDWFSSSVIKPFFARPRPSHNADIIAQLHLVRNYHGGAFGFFSAHAANSFGAVTLVVLLYRRTLIAVAGFAWAVAFCYSRLYLGVHYVGDVVCGALWGVLMGLAAYALFAALRRRFGAGRHPLAPMRDTYRGRDSWKIVAVHYAAIGCAAVAALLQTTG